MALRDDSYFARRLLRYWFHKNGRWFVPAAILWNAAVLHASALVANNAEWSGWLCFGALYAGALMRLLPRMLERRFTLPGPDLEPPKALTAPLPPMAEKLVQEAVQRHYEAQTAAAAVPDYAALQTYERQRMAEMQRQQAARDAANYSQRMADAYRQMNEVAQTRARPREMNNVPGMYDSMYGYVNAHGNHAMRPLPSDPQIMEFVQATEHELGHQLSNLEYTELLKMLGVKVD